MSEKKSNSTTPPEPPASSPAQPAASTSLWHGAINAVGAFNPLFTKSTDKKTGPPSEPASKPAQAQGAPAEAEPQAQAEVKPRPGYGAAAASTVSTVGSAAGRAAVNTVRGAASVVRALNPMAFDSESDDDDDSGAGRDPVEKPEKQEVLHKKETALALLLRSAKNKYVEKGLEGKVTIQLLVGVVLSGEFCTIQRSDRAEDVAEDELKQLGALNFKALSAMDAIIANLSRRSKQYAGKELRSDVTLTQGVTFGIGIPFLISVGFQTVIQFEVTVRSLVDYRKRKDKLREFQRKLKKIKNARELISEVMGGGFSLETAQRAVVATDGESESAALRWAADNDKEYALCDRLQVPY